MQAVAITNNGESQLPVVALLGKVGTTGLRILTLSAVETPDTSL